MTLNLENDQEKLEHTRRNRAICSAAAMLVGSCFLSLFLYTILAPDTEIPWWILDPVLIFFPLFLSFLTWRVVIKGKQKNILSNVVKINRPKTISRVALAGGLFFTIFFSGSLGYGDHQILSVFLEIGLLVGYVIYSCKYRSAWHEPILHLGLIILMLWIIPNCFPETLLGPHYHEILGETMLALAIYAGLFGIWFIGLILQIIGWAKQRNASQSPEVYGFEVIIPNKTASSENLNGIDPGK